MKYLIVIVALLLLLAFSTILNSTVNIDNSILKENIKRACIAMIFMLPVGIINRRNILFFI